MKTGTRKEESGGGVEAEAVDGADRGMAERGPEEAEETAEHGDEDIQQAERRVGVQGITGSGQAERNKLRIEAEERDTGKHVQYIDIRDTSGRLGAGRFRRSDSNRGKRR